MELFDKDGNKYIVQGAVLANDIKLKEKYKKLWSSKVGLYYKYYVEAIGDTVNRRIVHRVKRYTKTSVCFDRGCWSEGWSHFGYITFQIADLEGSDEDFIKMLNKRAIARLEQEQGSIRHKLNKHISCEEDRILSMEKLIDNIKGRM